MAFIQNFLLPLIQAVITFGMLALIILGCYFLIKKYSPKAFFNFKMRLKYGMFKRPYDERMVAWAMDMFEENVPNDKLQYRFYLTNQFDLGEFDEGLFVYNKLKKMKSK